MKLNIPPKNNKMTKDKQENKPVEIKDEVKITSDENKNKQQSETVTSMKTSKEIGN